MNTPAATAQAVVELAAADLKGGKAYCPNPRMGLWNQHPRVYIDMSHGEGRCAYCGTVYRMKPGETAGGH